MKLPKTNAETAVTKITINPVIYTKQGNYPAMNSFIPLNPLSIVPASRYYNARITGWTNFGQCNAAFDRARAYNIFTVSRCDNGRDSCFRRIKQTDDHGVDRVRTDFQTAIDQTGHDIDVEINTRRACT